MGLVAVCMWVAAANAEQIGVESLAWKTFDSDVVVRATVEVVQQAPLNPGVVRETVALRIDEVLHGQQGLGPLSFEWQTFTGHTLAPSSGHDVVLFLKAAPDGALSPRSMLGAALDLDQLDPVQVITEECAVLHSRDEVLAHLRALPGRPAALAGQPTPAAARRVCDASTEGFRVSWAGSGVDVLVPPGDLDALGEPQLWLQGLTEPMHWFGVGLFSVEYAGCVVGVPAGGEGDPLVLTCSVPGGAGPGERPPRDLREPTRAARRAAQAAIDNGHDRVKVTEVAYQGYERRALLCDGAFDGVFWSQGLTLVGFDTRAAHTATGLMHLGAEQTIEGCTGRPLVWTEPPGTRSMLLDHGLGREPGLSSMGALLEALPRLLASAPPVPFPWGEGLKTTAPIGLERTAEGRPQPAGPGTWIPLPPDGEARVRTRVRYLTLEQGRPVVVGDVTVPGVPDDWSVAAGPTLAPGAQVHGLLEVYVAEPDGSSRTLAIRSLRGL